MKIARHWGRDPSWFYELPKKDQIKLMAAWRVENMSAKDIKKKVSGGKEALIRRKIQEYANRDRAQNG